VISERKRELIRKLLDQGWSKRGLARALGIPQRTVIRISREPLPLTQEQIREECFKIRSGWTEKTRLRRLRYPRLG
jgi:DNA invertase Pin-like site-specific DNA recombinase